MSALLGPSRRRLFRRRLAVRVGVIVLASAASAGGQQARDGPRDPATRAAEMRGFLDDYFARAMPANQVPGAVVAVVDGGRVAVIAGYGVADVEARTPVDPERTVFRVASVAKVFTALAALQLVDGGRLELHGDVNRRLSRLRVGAGGDPAWGPVTLHQLLTHTAGLDERVIGYLSRPGDPYPTLGDYLARRMPPRTSPPGVVASYSNHGYALAGLLVEEAAGLPFREYAARHVFGPLGMSRTAFLVPPLPPSAADLAAEYRSTGERVPPAYSRPYPAGALGTTAADAARFLEAFLAAARGDPNPVLPPRVVRWMTERQFTHAPGLPGYSYGFAEQEIAGRRVLLKGGAAPYHSAVVVLLPDANAGLFVALNRQEPAVWSELLPALVRRFYPVAGWPDGAEAAAAEAAAAEAAAAASAAARTPPGDLRRFAGSYRWTRNARRSAEKVLSLATDVRVRVRGDSLALEALVPLPAEGWRRVGPLRFERGADGHYLAFREDERGHVSHLFLDIAGDHFAFERVPWTRTPGVQLTLFALPMAVLLSFPVARSAAGAARRLRRAAPAAPHGRRADGPPAIAAHAAALAAAAFTGGTLAVLANARELAYGPTPLLRVVLAVPIALAALSALLVYFAAAAWGRRQWSLPSRLYYTTVAAAAAALVAWLQAYDLLGYHL